jgi:hypothetical protein
MTSTIVGARATRALALAAALAAEACSDHVAPPAPADAGSTAPPAPPLRDEAAFVDVPPQAQGAGQNGRMFYVFEVADEDPAHRPLAVFMAGGPGYPSSLALVPYGAGRATLDPSTPTDLAPRQNLASWTSFANVLFIDERQTGFSYEMGPEVDAGACAFSPIDDAADHVRVLLHFLDGHPALQAAPVIIVGQSYGGTRATLMLDLLLRYPGEATRADAAIEGEIQAHYDAVFPDHAGTRIAPALAVTQFRRAVLLQPLVAGGIQDMVQAPLVQADPYLGAVSSNQDPYDVRQPAGWSQALDESAARALGDLGAATTLLAVDPRAIPRLGPPARAGAFRLPVADTPATQATNAALTAALGPLAPGDRYLVYPSTACPTGASLAEGAGAGNEFVANLRDGVRTFISDARYDSVIYSPAIPAVLQEVGTVTMDTAPRPGVARPGWFRVSFPQNGAPGPALEVRFPPYVDSGHFVTVAEPQHLHDDVAAWLDAGP